MLQEDIYIERCREACRDILTLCIDVPIDLHFSVARDFFDTSRDRGFKLSFSENNIVYWEDGETLGPRLVEFS